MSEHENENETADDAEAIEAANATPDEGAPDGADDAAASDDEDAAAADDAEPAPTFEPPANAMTEKELEANQKKIDRARASFYDRVTAIMGEDAQALVPCPACSYFVPGLIFPQELPDQVKAELWPFLGLPDPNDIAEAPDRRRCPTCKGRGKLQSGSLIPEYAIVKCRDCKGMGFKDDNPPTTSENGANGAVLGDELGDVPPMPEDEAWIEAARSRGYTIVPPFAQQGS
jgi:hypothetical protein